MQAERYIGEILVRRGALEAERMEELLRTAVERNARLLDVLIATRETEEATLVKALADEIGIPFIAKLKTDDVDVDLTERVPIVFARTHRVLPLSETAHTVRVATSNPLDPAPLDDLRALLGKRIEPVAATPEAIEDLINTVYERKDQENLGEHESEDAGDELQDLIDMTDEAPVIRWVNNLFYNAARSGASDIHIEPGDKEVVVRNRIDGRLYPVKTAHKGFLNSIVSRVKIEAGLNIAEKRLPQDGRITKKIQGRLIDVRVSTVPTARGERIVMRLLDKERTMLVLEDLGFEGGRLETLHHLISRPNGILLVTGPTGSGKTTTLYAGLSYINAPERNILTAEDPVEYELPGVGQVQTHPKIGLTFASALRSFLRQDPDVIMVGEIRDHETAEIAIHASLTGHLVLSTLHTNDAAGAVTRLVEMGVQPFLIASSVLGVVAQRLVRRLCPHCRQPYHPSAQDVRSLGFDPSRHHVLTGSGVQNMRGFAEDASSPETSEHNDGGNTQVFRMPTAPLPGLENGTFTPEKFVFYRPPSNSDGSVGCDACAHTGYKGRIAISELLLIDEPVRREILNQSDAASIARTAMSRDMRSLREDGARLVMQGTTSLAEVLAATQAGEME